MVGARRKATRRGAAGSPSAARLSPRTTRGAAARDGIPTVYQEMLAEAGAGPSRMTSETPERPLKRRRAAPPTPSKPVVAAREGANSADSIAEAVEEDEGDIQFEDVELPAPTIQTAYRDSDDDDDNDEDDVQFEDIDFATLAPSQGPDGDADRNIELNLTAHKEAMMPKRMVDRRKPISKAEKERRVEIHKMHLLCLLSHLAKRNHWCNDPVVQETLRPLLTPKIITYLNPGRNLSQFGQTESLKTGLKQAAEIFKSRFSVTERGLRRALWAEDEAQLNDYQLPVDVETCLEKSDFRKAANTLQGSRDVGAQLFCALLRAAGVETRLVCSLQPLTFVPGGPTLPKQRTSKTSSKAAKAEAIRAAMSKYGYQESDSTSSSSPRRRLGHPNAASYHIPDMSMPSTSSPRPPPTPKRIKGESSFPVYWVEVLDVAHQKWAPVDPLVTESQWKPQKFEPPASDRDNAMTYVVAFEADGSARDVTKRYAKAFNSKTKRMRIDGPIQSGEDTTIPGGLSGEKWWRRAMRQYAKRLRTDLDQIEETELAATEAREPMPRNVQDFKNHPVYALERHLRRHEVLVPGAQMAGTVGAGSKGPLERIYRRRDVRIARSAEKWYRMGREVKPGEQPVKILPKRVRKSRISFGEDDEEEEEDPVLGIVPPSAGTPIYMLEQTELYRPPPVINGRVPKNKFGNLDVYVPGMVPEGGVHILNEHAAHAAFILGVDYSPALTGFQFKGRKGTAVLHGAVVPKESEEAVRAVIEGFGDLEAQMEEERRTAKALRMWSRLLKALRIRQRIWANVDSDAEEEQEAGGFEPEGEEEVADEEIPLDDDAASDVTEEYFMEEDDDGGGGFLIE